MTTILVQSLYSLTQQLLMGVLAVLGLAAAWLPVALGALVREALDRWWYNRHWRDYLRRLKRREANPGDWMSFPKVGLAAILRTECGPDATPARLETQLPDAERRAARALAPLPLTMRIGPMLGLIGTLIPLGPALDGLAAGDFAQLGANLNVAFTTTTCGLLIGAAAYAIYVVRRSFFDHDLASLETVLRVGTTANYGVQTSNVDLVGRG